MIHSEVEFFNLPFSIQWQPEFCLNLHRERHVRFALSSNEGEISSCNSIYSNLQDSSLHGRSSGEKLITSINTECSTEAGRRYLLHKLDILINLCLIGHFEG